MIRRAETMRPMVRRAESMRRSRVREELMLPSPERIKRLTAEIQENWTAAQRARRAGQALRVQLMVVRALDLVPTTAEEV